MVLVGFCPFATNRVNKTRPQTHSSITRAATNRVDSIKSFSDRFPQFRHLGIGRESGSATSQRGRRRLSVRSASVALSPSVFCPAAGCRSLVERDGLGRPRSPTFCFSFQVGASRWTKNRGKKKRRKKKIPSLDSSAVAKRESNQKGIASRWKARGIRHRPLRFRLPRRLPWRRPGSICGHFSSLLPPLFLTGELFKSLGFFLPLTVYMERRPLLLSS